jgi:hypothetical protein
VFYLHTYRLLPGKRIEYHDGHNEPCMGYTKAFRESRAFGNWNRRHQMAAAEAAAEAAELSGTDRMLFSTIM